MAYILSFEVILFDRQGLYDVCKQLSPLFSITEDCTEINITINLNAKFISSESLLLIVAAIRSSDYFNVEKSITINCFQGSESYAARMNFHRALEVDYDELFLRQNPENRFVEISNVQIDDYETVSLLTDILYHKTNLGEDVIGLLDWSIGEIVDNLRHCKSFNGGWIVAQFFPKINKLRFIIADSGIGIHKSLISNPEYVGYTEEEALRGCVKKGVTGSPEIGMGNGLYYTQEFIRKNEGTLRIHSGSFVNQTLNGYNRVFKSTYWKGTYVYGEINTSRIVKMEDILNDRSHIDVIKERYETIEDLW